MTKSESLELMRLMRMDLTQLQARLSDLMRSVAGSDWSEPEVASIACRLCGVKKRTAAQLEEHMANVHDRSSFDSAWLRVTKSQNTVPAHPASHIPHG